MSKRYDLICHAVYVKNILMSKDSPASIPIAHVSEDGRIHHLIDHLREVGRLAGLGCETVTKCVRRIVKDANYML